MRRFLPVFLIIGLLGGWPTCADACEVLVIPPQVPDRAVVVVAGVVAGYVKSDIPSLGVSRAAGLRIRITEALSGTGGETEAEVYPLATGPDCKPVPLDGGSFNWLYPVAGKVTVVGRRPPLVIAANGVLTVACEATAVGGVAPVHDVVPRTITGDVDFRALRKDHPWAAFADYEFYRLLLAMPSLSLSRRISLVRDLMFYWRLRSLSDDLAEKWLDGFIVRAGIPRSDARQLVREFRDTQRRAR